MGDFFVFDEKSPNFIEIRAEKEPRRFGNPVFYLFLCLREFPFEREWIRWIRTAKNTDPNEKKCPVALYLVAHDGAYGRVRMRNAAIDSRDNFEQQVMRLGLPTEYTSAQE